MKIEPEIKGFDGLLRIFGYNWLKLNALQECYKKGPTRSFRLIIEFDEADISERVRSKRAQ